MSKEPLAGIEHEFKGDRADIIPVLQKIQSVYGYLPQEAIRHMSRWLKISENEIYGVATFYAEFRFTPPGRHHLKVCFGTSCHVKGAEQMLEALKFRFEIKPGETTADGKYDLERVGCLGCCGLAPVVLIDDEVHGRMNRVTITQLLESIEPPSRGDEAEGGK
ncbi:MAG: NADH-quinone oxidoreductase subunit NuoE [Syntrophobacteraceae bacterium]